MAEQENNTKAGWFLPRRVILKRHVRRMQGDETGGTEPQILEDTDGQFWMVKPPNHRQGGRVLASELIAGTIANRIGAATPEGVVCTVTTDVAGAVTFADGQPWAAGDAFGSALLNGAAPYIATMGPTIENRGAALLVVALDTWLAAYDGRQTRVTTDLSTGHHTVYGVDFGHSIGSGSWDAATLAGQADPTGLIDPQGWSTALGTGMAASAAAIIRGVGDDDLRMALEAIPASWGVPKTDVEALLSYLVRRRDPVANLLDQLA